MNTGDKNCSEILKKNAFEKAFLMRKKKHWRDITDAMTFCGQGLPTQTQRLIAIKTVKNEDLIFIRTYKIANIYNTSTIAWLYTQSSEKCNKKT